jgi:hypothetical protein
MRWLGYIVTLFGLYVTYAGTVAQYDYRWGSLNFDWRIAVVFSLVGGGIVTLGTFLTNQGLKTEQVAADRYANAVVGGEDNVPEQPYLFSLYLRPFDISGVFRIRPPPTDVFNWDQYDRPGDDALERLLADAVIRTAPLVGLGPRGDVEFGFGSAGFVADWKDKIRESMDAAAFVFVVPAANEGTLWEIGEIKSRSHFDKAIFIMPPTVAPFVCLSLRDYTCAWEGAREACARKHELRLPPYSPSGMLFQIAADSNGELGVVGVEFKGSSPRKVARSINKLLSAARLHASGD